MLDEIINYDIILELHLFSTVFAVITAPQIIN